MIKKRTMALHHFSNILTLFFKPEQIRIAYSCKVSFSNNNDPHDSHNDSHNREQSIIDHDRISYLLEDISLDDALYLTSLITDNKLVYDFVNTRYDSKKCIGYSFAGVNIRLYIENLNHSSHNGERFVIESLEWNRLHPNVVKERNYVRCYPDMIKDDIPIELHPYLNFGNCHYREEGNQRYVQFKMEDKKFIYSLDDELISKLLLLYKGNGDSREFKDWLNKNKHLKPSCIQLNDNSFTVYLR